MSAKKAMLEAVQADRAGADPLACFRLADLLEEEGVSDLSFAYRWMGWRGGRPGYREGMLLRKRFVWYEEKAFEAPIPTVE